MYLEYLPFYNICQIAVLVLAVACVNCIPVDSTSSKPVQDGTSDLKLEESPSDTSEHSEPHGTNIQKIPTKGTKLSSLLDETESSTTAKPSKTKRQSRSEESSVKPALKQDEEPKHRITPAPELVSLKTPIVHASGAKTKRNADGDGVATTNRPTSTRAPIPSSNSYDERDNTGPHFVRPVPVEQILKNIHEAPRHHLPSPISSHHEDTEPVDPTPVAEPTDDDNHKAHHKSFGKQQESKKDEKIEDQDESKEKDQEDDEEKRK